MSPSETLALNLILDRMQTSAVDRGFDYYKELARRLPKLDALHYDVNQRLKEWNERDKENGKKRSICDFRAGDKHIWHRPYPKMLSKETVRKAVAKSGLRELKKTGKIKAWDEFAETAAVFSQRDLARMDFELQKQLHYSAKIRD